MGKKAPATPDPVATANAQAAINTQTATQQAGINADTARLNAIMNRGNTITPMGTVTNRSTFDAAGYWAARPDVAASGLGAADHFRRHGRAEGVTGFGDPDQWETTTTLSPGQQQIFNQGETLDRETGRIALNQIPRLENIINSDVSMAGMPDWARDDADARDRATAGIMSRMEPQFQRDREGLEARLLSQGFVPGSEGYNRAADELGRARTDARMQAVTAGLGESRAAAGFNNATRGQMLGERLTLRQQPINEISALFGLGPGLMAPQQAQLAGVNVGATGINAPDMMGLTQSNYQAANSRYNAQMAAMAQVAGAAMGAGASYATGGASGAAGAAKAGGGR